MSQEEVNRLVSDVTTKPLMLAEAMMIKDLAGMKAFIAKKGYDLTNEEMAEVWRTASRMMGGGGQAASEEDTDA